MTDRCACGAQALPGGFLGPWDSTAVGGTILARGQTVHRMDVVAQHAAAARADAGSGLPQIPRVGVMVVGRVAAGAFAIAPPRIVIVDARAIDVATLVHRRLSTALGAPSPVGLRGELLAERRHSILAVGLGDVCQACGPLAGQRHPAPEPGAGGPPGGRIDIGLREHPPAQQHRNFVGIARVVLGLAPLEGRHGAGLPAHEGHPRLSTAISPPRPGEQTFDPDDDILAIGRDGSAERFWRGGPVTVHQHLPSRVHEAAVQRAGMQVAATITLVRLGVKSPEVSSA